MTRILLTADWHLTAEPTVARINPVTGLPVRFEDLRGLLGKLVDVAIQEHVAGAVIAGDLVDHRRPSPLIYRTAQAAIRALNDAGIETLILGGNHDGEPATGQVSAVEVLEPRRGIVVSGGPDIFDFAGGLQVAAFPWLGRSQLLTHDSFKDTSPEALNQILAEKLLHILRAYQARRDPERPALLTMHGTVSGAALGSEQNVGIMAASSVVLNLHDILDLNYDAVGLGHIHHGQEVEAGVYYAGSLHRVTFGEASEKKGVWILDIERGQATKARFIDLDDRKYISCDIHGGVYDLADLDGAIVRVTGTWTPEEAATNNPEDFKRVLYERGALDVSWAVETERTSAVRVSTMTESLTPAAALDLYLEQHPDLPTDALRDRGRALIAGSPVDVGVATAISPAATPAPVEVAS